METGAKWRILSNEHNLQTPIEQKHREDHKVVTKLCFTEWGIHGSVCSDRLWSQIREGTCADISSRDTAGLEPVVNISTRQGPN